MDFFDLLVNAKSPDNMQPQAITQQSLFDNIPTTKSQQTKQESKKTVAKKKKQKVGTLLDEDLFLKILQETHKSNQESSMSYDKKWISSGDITCLCPRKAYFRFTNSPYELQLFYPYTELITHVGSAIHEWVQKHLAKVYDKVESEIKFELPDERVKGFIDLVYETDDGKTVILEIKTGGDEILDQSFQGKHAHWKQLAFYYWIWTNKLNRKCDHVQLMYLKRDFKPVKLSNGKLQPFKIFTVKEPTKLWDYYGKDIMYMLDTIKKALKENNVPDIPPERYQLIKKEECGFCPYQKICSKYPIQSNQQSVQNAIELLF